MTRRKAALVVGKTLAVATVFAFCGVWTERVVDSHKPAAAGLVYVLAAMLVAVVPFGAWCGLLFLRTRRIGIVILLMAAVLAVAEFTAVSISLSDGRVGLICGILSGGLVGGVGIQFCVAMGRRHFPSFGSILIAAIIGTVAALPLAISHWVRFHSAFGYAIWQAAVGTYLYALSTVHSISDRPSAALDRRPRIADDKPRLSQ